MPFEATLPAELWLIILDMVISTGITLLEQCDCTSFPDIYAYLLAPAPRAPFDNSYGQLRLVCRMFDALLGGSPHYIMESSRDSIPTSARAVCIIEGLTTSEHVRRLLEQPSICHRLVHLDTFSKHLGLSNTPTAFHLLCENSAALPDLRCLTLRFVLSWDSDLSFWGPLNDAFPLLRSLVIVLEHGHPFSLPEYDSVITFRNLELLISGNGIFFAPQLHFPRLRHIALDSFPERQLELHTRSPLLESALFQRLAPNSRVDLNVFPHLRYLRVCVYETPAIRPAGDDHPLEHLSLSVPGKFYLPTAVHYIMRMAKVLPRVSRITLDVPAELKAELEIRLQNADLQSFGLSISSDAYRIVLKRIQMDNRMSDQLGSIKTRPFLSWVRSKFRR